MARTLVKCLDTAKLPWVSRMENPYFMGRSEESFNPRSQTKVLSMDPETGESIHLWAMSHVEGLGYAGDPAWHNFVEEVFFIDGEASVYEDYGVPYTHKGGYYLYRPPGGVHGHMKVNRDTLHIHYFEKYGGKYSEPFRDLGRNMYERSDAALGGRGFIKWLNTNDLEWIPATRFFQEHRGPFQAEMQDQDKLWFKVLSKGRSTGHMTYLAKLGTGYCQAPRTNNEEEDVLYWRASSASVPTVSANTSMPAYLQGLIGAPWM